MNNYFHIRGVDDETKKIRIVNFHKKYINFFH